MWHLQSCLKELGKLRPCKGVIAKDILLFMPTFVCAHLQSYTKEHGKMGPAFGHAGMVLSATAILKDMDDHGVLDTLFHGEEYKDQQYACSLLRLHA